MDKDQNELSRLQLWIGLTRPRTLLAGISSVLVAVFYASSISYLNFLYVGLLLIVAISAQVASNIANDLIDFRKGADTEDRKGPLRPLSKGLISISEVKWALYLSLAVLAIAGFTLVFLYSWWLLFVAVAVVLGIFAYSGGPFPLSYYGLGDVAVLVFFGLVPSLTSFCVLGGTLSDTTIWHLAVAIGLANINILVVNNYRDVAEDARVGKRTLVVRMGRDFAPRFYLSCGLLSIGLLYPIYSSWGMLVVMGYLLAFVQAYKSMETSEGTALNRTLGLTARNVFLLALSIGLLLLLRAC